MGEVGFQALDQLLLYYGLAPVLDLLYNIGYSAVHKNLQMELTYSSFRQLKLIKLPILY